MFDIDLRSDVFVSIVHVKSNCEEFLKLCEALGFITIDLDIVLNSFMLHYGITKALLNDQAGKLKTRQSIDVEIKYYLAPTKKISEAVRLLTPSGNTSYFAVISIGKPIENIQYPGEVMSEKDYDIMSMSSLEREKKIASIFKVTAEELGSHSLESSLITKLGVKDIV